MNNKRKWERYPIKLYLDVSEVFKQNNDVITDLNAEIEVFDISKQGIGFMTTTYIPLGYYFNATIVFEHSDQKILTVVKILYSKAIGSEGYRYGCEFVGSAGVFDYLFDEYEKFISD